MVNVKHTDLTYDGEHHKWPLTVYKFYIPNNLRIRLHLQDSFQFFQNSHCDSPPNLWKVELNLASHLTAAHLVSQ